MTYTRIADLNAAYISLTFAFVSKIISVATYGSKWDTEAGGNSRYLFFYIFLIIIHAMKLN